MYGDRIDIAADKSGAMFAVAEFNPGQPTDDTYLDNFDYILAAQ